MCGVQMGPPSAGGEQVEQGTQGGSLGSGIWPGVRDSGLHGCDGAGVGAVELEPLGSERHLGWVSAHVTGFRGAPRLPGNPATALSSQAPPPAAGFQALRPCEQRPAPALVPRCSGGLCARRLVRFAVTTPLRRLSKFSIKHFVVNFVTSKKFKLVMTLVVYLLCWCILDLRQHEETEASRGFLKKPCDLTGATLMLPVCICFPSGTL